MPRIPKMTATASRTRHTTACGPKSPTCPMRKPSPPTTRCSSVRPAGGTSPRWWSAPSSNRMTCRARSWFPSSPTAQRNPLQMRLAAQTVCHLLRRRVGDGGDRHQAVCRRYSRPRNLRQRPDTFRRCLAVLRQGLLGELQYHSTGGVVGEGG